jgi:hypothetical protein
MRIVFYTSGITGAGRLIIGISIGNALERKNIKCKYTMVHTSPLAHLADDFHHIKIPLENETELSKKNCHKSLLFKTLTRLKPDILLIDHLWFTVYNFIEELKCKKIYLTDAVYDSHFKVPLPEGDLVFKKEHYRRVLGIEPFTSGIELEMINPLIIRNREEIFSRGKALKLLNLDGAEKTALYAFSGHPGDYERFIDKYSYLEKEGYQVVNASIYKDTIFPVVDYFNAFDFIVSGAGYNQVWEINYFKKKAVFETTPQRFWDQSLRVKEFEKHHFEENGADQLVDIIMNL